MGNVKVLTIVTKIPDWPYDRTKRILFPLVKMAGYELAMEKPNKEAPIQCEYTGKVRHQPAERDKVCPLQLQSFSAWSLLLGTFVILNLKWHV